MKKSIKVFIFIKIFMMSSIFSCDLTYADDDRNYKKIQSTIIEKIPLPKRSSAQQGISSDRKDHYYSASNWIKRDQLKKENSKLSQSLYETNKKDQFVSKIYKFSKDLKSIKKELTIDPRIFTLWNSNSYLPHLGQITIDRESNMLYISIMDVTMETKSKWEYYFKKAFGKIIYFFRKQPYLYGRRTALLIFDKNLEFKGWIDFTNVSSYLDAIHLEKRNLWFSSNYIGVVNLENLENPKKINLKKYYVKFKGVSTAQGIKILDNNLYYVPENDKSNNRTNQNFWGILKYDLNNFIESKKTKIINYPKEVYNFVIPNSYGDYGSMDFLIGNNNFIYIPTNSDNGKNIYKIKLIHTNK